METGIALQNFRREIVFTMETGIALQNFHREIVFMMETVITLRMTYGYSHERRAKKKK